MNGGAPTEVNQEETNAARRAGLCADCVHADKAPSSRGALFYRCKLSEMDRAFPKYPRLPVIACRGYESSARLA